jgi:hypothetical protein
MKWSKKPTNYIIVFMALFTMSDFGTDVSFCANAWVDKAEMDAAFDADAANSTPATRSELAELEYTRSLALVSLVTLVLNTVVATIFTFMVRRLLICDAKFAKWEAEHRVFSGFAYMLACTRPDALQLLWCGMGVYDAPVAPALQLLIRRGGLIGNVLEDIPQFVVQLLYLIHRRGGGSATVSAGSNDFVVLSLFVTAANVVLQVLMRLQSFLCPPPNAERYFLDVYLSDDLELLEDRFNNSEINKSGFEKAQSKMKELVVAAANRNNLDPEVFYARVVDYMEDLDNGGPEEWDCQLKLIKVRTISSSSSLFALN